MGPTTLVKQTQGVVTTASTAPTAAVTATPGSTLVICWAGSGGSTGTFTALTDTGGNTWVKGPTIGGSGAANTFISIWYTTGAVSPGTITGTTSSQTFQWSCLEFANGLVVTPSDGTAQVSNASNTAQPSPAVTTTVPNDILVAGLNYGGTATSTLAAGSGGWTAATDPGTAGSNHLRVAYKIGTAAQAENAAWTLSVAAVGGLGTVALKAGAPALPRRKVCARQRSATRAGLI